MEYGVQLYSCRDFMKEDMAYALKRVAEIGYKYVEFAGFFGHSAKEVKAMLDANGLKVSATHSSLDELEADFEGTVRYHKTIGNTNYIIPGTATDTAEEVDRAIERLNKFQPMLAAEGITLAYHNHDREFRPNRDGVIAHEEMERRTNIDFQIDTYWSYVAGRDSVETITRLKDRVKVIHIKDGLADGEGFPLGLGTAPVADIYARAKELGMFMVVESETLNPDGLTEIDICFKYLKELEKTIK